MASPIWQSLTGNYFDGLPGATWPSPASIAYGTSLGSAQLDAASAVLGTFVYTPGAGTVLSARSNTLSVAFTPTDAADYTTASATVQIAVTALTPLITWPAPAAITFGTALGSSQLDATATIPGTFVYTPAAGTVPAVGVDTLSVTFTPTDLIDYMVATATTQITLTLNAGDTLLFSAGPNGGAQNTGLALTIAGP